MNPQRRNFYKGRFTRFMIINTILLLLDKRLSESGTEKKGRLSFPKRYFRIKGIKGKNSSKPVAISTLPLGLTTKAPHAVVIRTKH